MRKLISAFILTLLVTAFCPAGIFRHDVPVEKFQALAREAQFDPVGRVRSGDKNLGSLVMIDKRWALTAAHMFEKVEAKDIKLEIEGVTYDAERIVIHPDHKNADLSRSTDLALVKLTSEYKKLPATLYEKDKVVGMIGTIVGFGNFRSATEPGPRGTGKLAGQNMIDIAGDAGEPANVLGVDLDSPTDPSASRFGANTPIDLEYILDGGDSGGGFFIQYEKKWYLAAINTRSLHDMDRLKAFEKNGFYGSRSYFTRVSTNIEWIKKTIRE